MLGDAIASKIYIFYGNFVKIYQNTAFCNFACTKVKLSEKVGCRLPWWEKWSGAQDRPICKSDQQFQQFEQIYKKFLHAESYEIINMTGCKSPCKYNEYKFATSSPEVMPRSDSKSTLVGFWVASRKTWVEEEVLLYSFTSLVAEFGGSLGLFLGFSFLTLWQEVRGCCCK